MDILLHVCTRIVKHQLFAHGQESIWMTVGWGHPSQRMQHWNEKLQTVFAAFCRDAVSDLYRYFRFCSKGQLATHEHCISKLACPCKVACLHPKMKWQYSWSMVITLSASCRSPLKSKRKSCSLMFAASTCVGRLRTDLFSLRVLPTSSQVLVLL